MSWINRRWHISSFSGQNGCVEVRQDGEAVFVRHSHRPDGPVLQFSRREWLAFLAGVRNSEFELTEAAEKV